MGKGLWVRLQRYLLVIIASFFASIVFPESANAAFPCTWAPGEVQVGEDNGVPLCEQRGPTQPTSGGAAADAPRFPSPLRLVDTYFAVAFHPGANDPWAIWKNQISLQNAEERVLAACNAVMGIGCKIVGSGANSFVVLGYQMDQSAGPQLVELGVGTSLKKARQNLKEKCKSRGYKCNPLDFFGTTPESDNTGIDFSTTYYPTEATVRRRSQVK
ncbi:DUF4189 domain-containing protein [Sphingorhabdus pulchriflava]|uniref:DUF4189 domain-containing protein n=1 Tax=Sphingorhabdus pulchriflava TaxID=2292257 RepID=A0A371B5U8_9SPHN|nr:DUF4189 domain-containing protein [Sphingorhabdus pulchriflava]